MNWMNQPGAGGQNFGQEPSASQAAWQQASAGMAPGANARGGAQVMGGRRDGWQTAHQPQRTQPMQQAWGGGGQQQAPSWAQMTTQPGAYAAPRDTGPAYQRPQSFGGYQQQAAMARQLNSRAPRPQALPQARNSAVMPQQARPAVMPQRPDFQALMRAGGF